MQKNSTEHVHIKIFITFQNTSILITNRMVNVECVRIYLLRKMTRLPNATARLASSGNKTLA